MFITLTIVCRRELYIISDMFEIRSSRALLNAQIMIIALFVDVGIIPMGFN